MSLPLEAGDRPVFTSMVDQSAWIKERIIDPLMYTLLIVYLFVCLRRVCLHWHSLTKVRDETCEHRNTLTSTNHSNYWPHSQVTDQSASLESVLNSLIMNHIFYIIPSPETTNQFTNWFVLSAMINVSSFVATETAELTANRKLALVSIPAALVWWCHLVSSFPFCVAAADWLLS